MTKSHTYRLAIALAAAVVALAVGAGAQASDRPPGMTAQQYRAELVRGDALNRLYGLGKYAHTAPVAAPASSPVSGFDWGDAGIGFAAAVGTMLVAAATLVAARRRPLLHG
jgi:hypothetical protein